MFEENPITLVKRVCKQLHVEKNIGLFSAQHLINMYGLTDPEDIDSISNAFAFLTAQGYFTIEADVFDKDANQVWGGDPAKHELGYLESPNREPVRFEDCFVQVSFSITEKLKQEIENEGNENGKSE